MKREEDHVNALGNLLMPFWPVFCLGSSNSNGRLIQETHTFYPYRKKTHLAHRWSQIEDQREQMYVYYIIFGRCAWGTRESGTVSRVMIDWVGKCLTLFIRLSQPLRGSTNIYKHTSKIKHMYIIYNISEYLFVWRINDGWMKTEDARENQSVVCLSCWCRCIRHKWKTKYTRI